MARAKTRAKFSNRKISETFLDFAEPLLDPLGAEVTEHEMEGALMIAFSVWNAVVFDAVDRSSRWVDRLREDAGHNPLVCALVEQLIDRKRSLFGQDQRLIGEYQLYRQGGKLRLRAEARAPRTKAKPPKRPR